MIRLSAHQAPVQGYLHTRTRTYAIPAPLCGAPSEAVLAGMIADPEYDDWLVGEDRAPLPEGWTPPVLPEGTLVHPPQHGPFDLERLSPDVYERASVEGMREEMQEVLGKARPEIPDYEKIYGPRSPGDRPYSPRAWEQVQALAARLEKHQVEVFRLRLGMDDRDYMVSGDWVIQEFFVEYVVIDRTSCELTLIIALIN